MNIYRVRVTLRQTQPPIWRRIELSGQTTLDEFHRILQLAMGWYNCHLHMFEVDGEQYGASDPDYDDFGEVIPEEDVRLAEVLPAPGAKLLYTYDFGDDWRHQVRLEAVFPPEPGMHYPRISAGKRKCPPEDCGGAGNYDYMLVILQDPAHEQFQNVRDQLGPHFNAQEFSVDAANQRLQGRDSFDFLKY